MVFHFLLRVDFCVLLGLCFVSVAVSFLRGLATGGLLLFDLDLVAWMLLLERARCADASCWRSSHWLHLTAFLTAQLLAATYSSRLILLPRNSRIVRRCKDRGGLWLLSRGLGRALVYSGGGDAGWFGGLFWVCVRAGLICTTISPFLCLFEGTSGFSLGFFLVFLFSLFV